MTAHAPPVPPAPRRSGTRLRCAGDSTGVVLASTAHGRAVLLAAGIVVVLAGCALDPVSDPNLDPEILPLEVVVDSDTQPDHPCLLNYDPVRAGDHAGTVIGVSGYA